MKLQNGQNSLKKEISEINYGENLNQTDSSMGVLNKEAMSQIISEKISRGGTFFLIDFDDMKKINEVYGAEFVNEILRDFAEELKFTCRDSDSIGRINGEEFFVFMPQVLTKKETHNVIERFQKNIQRKINDDKVVDIIRNVAGIAVTTTIEHNFGNLDDVLGYLQDTLHRIIDKTGFEEVENENSNEIFSRVFSTQTRMALSDEEMTETLQAVNNAYQANYFIRLTDKSYAVLKRRELIEDGESTTRMSVQELLNFNINRNVKEDFRDNFLDFANLDTLNQRMSERDTLKFEYQNVFNQWCLATFAVIKRENGAVTKVVLLISNLTDDRAAAQQLLRRQKEAVSLLSNSQLLFVSIINKTTGESSLIQSSGLLGVNKDFNFNLAMEKEAAHILPTVREEFVRNSSLEKIRDELSRKERYTITSFLVIPDNGRCRRMMYHFANCKDSDDYIIAATEDVTEQYIMDTITERKNFEGFRLDCVYEFSRETPDCFVVINFNIVNFKAINTIYGYEKGNEMLRNIMRELLKEEYRFVSVCRENADNFFCLCRKEDYDIETIKKICNVRIETPRGDYDTLDLICGIYGISDNTETFEVICDKARLARRLASREVGTNTYILSEEEKEHYLDDAVVLASLSKAIRNEEMVVYYQPIYDAMTGVPIGAEALARWKHPEKGLLTPAVFIPAIEHTGQIVELDQYVTRHICNFQKERMDSGKYTVPVSINMSRHDFHQEDKMENILSVLKENPSVASKLRVEITESGFIDFPKQGEFFIYEMRNLGIETMIDDFGTGYSSLASIVERPCDIIKLDMSFARKIGVEKKIEILIVSAIEMAHRLGVTVVAEGVETKEQYEFLKENKCDFIQGYYFSKPLSQEEFEGLLDEM